MRLTDLNPRWVGAGGEGVYQATGRLCPTCPPDAYVADCPTCFGRGTEFAPVPARHGVGISFDCPCAACTAARVGELDTDWALRCFISFRNPLDGGPPHDPREGAQWERRGDTFETLLTQPSILRVPGKGGCGWHGYIGGPAGDQPGEVVTV